MAVGKLLGIGIKSALEEGVEQIPAKTLKGAKGAENALLRTGVKKEEIEMSGVLDGAPEGQASIATEEVQAAVANRKDSIDVVDGRDKGVQNYSKIRPDSMPENPTYREDVYTFSQRGADSSKGSEHYDVDNYLAHARRQDAMLGGKRTRVVMEIQSDLHQNQIGAAEGQVIEGGIDAAYDRLAALMAQYDQGLPDMLAREMVIDSVTNKAVETLPESVNTQLASSAMELAEAAASGDKGYFKTILDETFGGDAASLAVPGPKAPWKDNWFTKVLERQMDQSAQDGVFNVAVPLSGEGTGGLIRSERVANTYATQHRKTMKKLAKRHGWTYSEVNEGFNFPDLVQDAVKSIDSGELAAMREAAKKLADKLPEGSPGRDAADAMLSLREGDVGKSYFSVLAKQIKQALNSAANDSVTYGVISFGEDTSAAAGFNSLRAAVEAGDMAAAQDAGAALAKTLPDGPEKDMAELYASGAASKYGSALQAQMLEELGVVEQTLKKSKQGGFSLYSSPAAGAFAAYAMLRSEGEEQTRANMASQGMEPEEIEGALEDAALVAKFTEAGASEAQIKGWFESKQPKVEAEDTQNTIPVSEESYFNEAKLPSLEEQISAEGENAQAKIESNMRQEQTLRARELLSSDETLASNELFGAMRVLHPDTTFLSTTVSGLFGDEEALKVAEENASRSTAQIQKTLNSEFGLDVSYNPELGVWIDNQSGQEMTLGVWDDIWQDLKGSRYELGYGVAGGIAGARVGSSRYGFLGGVAGGAVGAVFGSALGTNLDYMREAFRLDQEMQGAVAFRKTLNSAELSLIGDAAGAALIKVFGSTIRGGKRIINYARGGDIPSATKALEAHMAVTTDEATEIATQLSRLSDVPGSTQAEKNIAATVMTQPGGERIVKAATASRPRAGQALIRSVDDRAQALLKHSTDLQHPQAGRQIVQDLDNYRADVRQFYGDVKAEAAQSVRANDFSFDFDEIAVEPVLASLKKEITDPTARLRFLNQTRQIKQYAKTRKFSDLLELRQLVNNLTYSRKIRNAKDFKALRDVISGIDEQIEAGAKVATDNPEEWLGRYREANRLYSDMKELENNQLYKLLNRKGMSAQGIAKALTRYAPSLDDTYHNVINKLPRQTRDAVEGEVFSTLAAKYTTGVTGGLRATQFPMLADELKSIPFTTPGARKLRDATVRLGEVFKNDIPLAQSGGQLQIPQFQSYLTTDPVVRAKFEIASGVFNKIKQMVPGEQQQDLALVNALTDLLDKPMNAKLMDELIKEAGDRVDVESGIKAMADAAARQAAKGADVGAPKVKLYGTGKVQSLKGAPGQESTESIPMHRIASSADVEQIAISEGINVSDKKAIDEVLSSRGYSAVQLGTNKIRRLDQ